MNPKPVEHRIAAVVPFPAKALDASTPTREAVTLAEVPGFLGAVRDARALRPDIDRSVYVRLGRRWHPSFHPTASRVSAEALIVAADLARARGAA